MESGKDGPQYHDGPDSLMYMFKPCDSPEMRRVDEWLTVYLGSDGRLCGVEIHAIEKRIKEAKRKKAKRKKADANIPENYTMDFERFWRVYPKRVRKPVAFEEWQLALGRLLNDEEAVDRIVSRAWLFSLSPKAKTEFVPDPERWLKHSRYRDDPKAWGFTAAQIPWLRTESEKAGMNSYLAGLGGT